jgi:uncharacterized circularly permuted ATP-grasp superfamily protein/uncharacterized alpha-E superfamily protein
VTVSQQDIPTSTPAKPHGFADGYAPLAGVADEMVEPDGSLRAHWRPYVSALDDLGTEEVARRWEQARRLIHENGVTHNVYGTPNGLDRPWSLDFVPLLIKADEWRSVSVALEQRARLLDLLLADLYGEASVVADGLLPAELVYANPSFLRPCHGIELPHNRHLHLYGADIVRGPGGAFQVLSDRTQAPSGAGYTLESRIVLSRVLPTVFRTCNVNRLAPFFASLRQTLASLASPSRENPRVVLLTPGPYNETYFEHAYLSRYLGYTLVQGNDLTVRDANVYLKTLGGLQRVDVILRRVDDDFCDPLELFPHSFLGVPGLLECVREGNVAVANALGSGMLQGPAFLPFLPALCRRLLDQDLKMPSVPTWWCGQRASRDHVLANLHKLVIKHAFPTRGADPIFGDDLSSTDLEKLRANIINRPTEYVAQEPAMNSTAPALPDGKAQPRRFIVRAYLAANAGGGFVTMTGGLTRITDSPESRVVSLQKGGGSKDTWVLADGPVPEVTLLPAIGGPIALSRGGSDLPSRIADDLFWLGRYMQRAEAIARAGRAAFNRLVDPNPDSGRTAELLATEVLGRRVPRAGLDGRLERELTIGVFGRNQPFTLRSTVDGVHGLARVLRDRISVDAWRILQAIQRDVDRFEPGLADPVASVLEMLNKLIVSVAAFGGLTMDSMTRGQAWRFLDIGHRVERATSIARLLRSTLTRPTDDSAPLLDAVLEIADSSLTYRRRYFTHLEVPAVVDLLLADEDNPRAVAFQVAAIQDHLLKLPREVHHPHRDADRLLALRLRTTLQLADLQQACKPVGNDRPALLALLNDTIDALAGISDRVGQVYFSHAEIPQHLQTYGGANDVDTLALDAVKGKTP